MRRSWLARERMRRYRGLESSSQLSTVIEAMYANLTMETINRWINPIHCSLTTVAH